VKIPIETLIPKSDRNLIRQIAGAAGRSVISITGHRSDPKWKPWIGVHIRACPSALIERILFDPRLVDYNLVVID
jgi:hypothetical protein